MSTEPRRRAKAADLLHDIDVALGDTVSVITRRRGGLTLSSGIATDWDALAAQAQIIAENARELAELARGEREVI